MPSLADRAARPLHWASLREAGQSAGMWFLYGVYRFGGRWLVRLMLWPVALYYVATRGVARRASIEFLQRVGVIAPDAGLPVRWAHATRHVERFADALLDKALAWTGALDLADTQLNVDPRFEAAVAECKGGMLVVAHYGNLEVLRALGQRLPRLKLNILVHTRHAQRFNRLLTRLNPESAAGLIQVTEIDVATAVDLSECVRRGEFVVIAADRVPVADAPGHTRTVPFFGAPAPLPVGPWVLAAALGCPVFWLSCRKDGGRYRLDCELLFERVELPRARRAEALVQVMARYAQRLETACRASPYSWFNFYPFWPGPAAAGPDR
jgi:predicted LPLAT superfamily acyltransferase